MSTRRPRVHAMFDREAETISTLQGLVCTPPGITIALDFDLHDHNAALALLDLAVADVTAQVAETAPETGGGQR